MQLISNKSDIKPDQRKTMLIDDCFADLSFMKIIELGILSYQKVFIEYSETQLKRIKKEMEKDEQFLKMVRQPEEYD